MRRRHLVSHCGMCEPCLRFVESYRKTSTLCKRTLVREAPRGLGARLREFLREQCSCAVTSRES